LDTIVALCVVTLSVVAVPMWSLDAARVVRRRRLCAEFAAS